MLGRRKWEGPLRKNYIEGLLRLAEEIPVRQIVPPPISMTGLWGRRLMTPRRAPSSVLEEKVPAAHGTGDIRQRQVLTLGRSLPEAVRAAVDFTIASIKWSAAAGTEVRYG